MKKIFCLLIILIIFGAASSYAIPLEKQNISNAFYENILYVGGGGPGNYTNIQDALDAASEGDTVFVYDDSSPYNENILIEKTVELIGENKETTVINGDSAGSVIVILAEYVLITGFSIQMTGISEGNAGISVRNNHSIITDNIILNNDWGISIYYTVYCTVIGNRFLNNNCGLYIRSQGNTIKENQFFNDGIYVSTSGNIIEDNTANYKPIIYLEGENNKLIDYECGQIILVDCSYITIQNLRITKTDTGIILSNCENCNIIANDIINCGSGIRLINSNYNNLSYNDLYQNEKTGITLSGSDYNTLEHNICSEHLLGEYRYHGLYLEGADNNTIKNNIFMDNNVGIGCSVSDDNIISENSISDNIYIGIILEGQCERNSIKTNRIKGSSVGMVLDDIGFNYILYNDFYENNENIRIEVLQLHKIRLFQMVKISGNYWDKARILPKFILGVYDYVYDEDIPWGGGFRISWIYVDWHPAKEHNFQS